ncbi:MAG: hypothetical protein NVV74_15910 [Magnetospirillum sp.]|nr:hypothetical protein [Magnetospirillum sp.]
MAEIGIKVILAGPIAQREGYPFSNESWAAADFDRASEIALRFSRSEDEARLFVALLATQVEEELHRRWEAVQEMAARLVEGAGRRSRPHGS